MFRVVRLLEKYSSICYRTIPYHILTYSVSQECILLVWRGTERSQIAFPGLAAPKSAFHMCARVSFALLHARPAYPNNSASNLFHFTLVLAQLQVDFFFSALRNLNNAILVCGEKLTCSPIVRAKFAVQSRRLKPSEWKFVVSHTQADRERESHKQVHARALCDRGKETRPSSFPSS